MPTTIAEKSKKIISNMIRNAFNELKENDEVWTEDEEYFELIDTATNYGLHDLANELIHDLPYQTQKNDYMDRQYTTPKTA